MKQIHKGWYTRGYLPHFDGDEILQFVTFRLYDPLPKNLIERWRTELLREETGEIEIALRKRIEEYLDQGHGNCYLWRKEIAKIMQNALIFLNGGKYHLISWVIMPNHVHFLARILPSHSLSSIMKSLKGFTAREANKMLGRKGAFWQEDYFDRYIRNERHYLATIAYIENNPVKAKLCEKKEDWIFGSASKNNP